jgi:Mrp family chromosome partitioning ATPase
MQDIADAEGALAEVADQNHEASERLSDFETSETLRPSWEVEVFDIPQAVADLFFEETLFQDLSSRMKEASQGGLRTMLMTSAMTGEGRTTVAIGVALAAAFSGLRVALVDGDLAEPTLAEELRLDLDHSWVESVRRGVPIKEVAVHAIEDNLTLIPLLPTDSGRQATAVECARMLESLKPSFDLIVVDGPTADAKDIRMLGSVIDSVIIVHDVNQSSDAAADLLAARLQRSGIDGVGIVENFV